MRYHLPLILLFFTLSWTLRAQIRTGEMNVSRINDTASISDLINKAKKFRHEHTDSSIQLYQTAFFQSKQIGYLDGIVRSLTGLGLSYMDKGDYNKSLFTYKLAKPYCEEASKTNGRPIAVLYNNIAALYGNRGILDTSVMYYYKSLEEINKRNVKDTTLLILIYSNLGGKLASIQQFSQANFYIQKGETIARMTGNKPMLAKIYLDKTLIYGPQEQYDSLRYFANLALEVFKEYPDPATQISALCNIAQSYLKQDNLHKAEQYYISALSNDINASRIQRAPVYSGLGECYLQLKDYPKAEKYFLEMLHITQQANTVKGVAKCYKSLVEVYTQMGNYKAAQQYRNKYDNLIDSTENAEKLKLLSELESKYRIAEKDKDIAEKQLLLKQKENEIKQKNILLGSVAGGTLLLMALFVSLYRTKKHKENLGTVRLEKERELTQLRATMKGEEKERIRIARELHDGIMVRFSSVQMNLSALIERSETGETEKLNDILSQLEEATKELRKSAHNLMPDMLLQEGLGEAAHYFCKTLQRSTGIEIDFQQYGCLPPIAREYELMAYRMIQELLQNVLKHAKATAVLVQLNCQPHMISIVVEDNGAGFDTHYRNRHTGIGLHSIEERVRSLHGNLSVSSNPGEGTSVYIELDTQYLQQNNSETYAH